MRETFPSFFFFFCLSLASKVAFAHFMILWLVRTLRFGLLPNRAAAGRRSERPRRQRGVSNNRR